MVIFIASRELGPKPGEREPGTSDAGSSERASHGTKKTVQRRSVRLGNATIDVFWRARNRFIVRAARLHRRAPPSQGNLTWI